MCGKLKVNVRKILKQFFQCSEVSKALEEIIQNKNWRWACLLMKEDNYFWFMILKIFWKTHVKVKTVVISKDQPLAFNSNSFCVRKTLYNPKNEDKNILNQKKHGLKFAEKIVNYHFTLSPRNMSNFYIMNATIGPLVFVQVVGHEFVTVYVSLTQAS